MQGYVITAALSAILAFGAGWTVNGWRHNAALYDQAAAYAEQVKIEQARADSLAADLEAARQVQAPKDRIIIKEVTRYETLVPPAARCQLDGRWRLLHDAAATGQPADSTRLADGAAEPVADAAALETVADNYETCRQWREQLIGLQQFVHGQ